MNLAAQLQNIDSDASSTVDADPESLEPLNGDPVQSRYQSEFNDTKYRVYSGTIDWDFGAASLESITSYGTLRVGFPERPGHRDQPDGRSAPGLARDRSSSATPRRGPLSAVLPQTTSTDKFTQELRLVSRKSESFEWLVGGYYTDEDSAIKQKILAVEAGTDTIAAGIPALADLSLDSTYEEFAGFANATWHVTAALGSLVRRPPQPQQAGRLAALRRPPGRRPDAVRRRGVLGEPVHLLVRAALRAREELVDLRPRRHGLPAGRTQRAAAGSSGGRPEDLRLGPADQLRARPQGGGRARRQVLARSERLLPRLGGRPAVAGGEQLRDQRQRRHRREQGLRVRGQRLSDERPGVVAERGLHGRRAHAGHRSRSSAARTAIRCPTCRNGASGSTRTTNGR